MNKQQVVAYFEGMRDVHMRMARKPQPRNFRGNWRRHHARLARGYNHSIIEIRRDWLAWRAANA